MKKIFLLVTASLLFIPNLQSMQIMENLKDNLISLTKATPKDIVLGCATFYLVMQACTIGHELGHALTYRALLGIPCTFHFSLNPFHAKMRLEKVPPKGVKNALDSLAGPLGGLLTAYIILKGANIMQYLNEPNILESLSKGLNLSLFNIDHGFSDFIEFAFLIGCGISIYGDLRNLLPTQPEIDGYQALQSLGYFQNK